MRKENPSFSLFLPPPSFLSYRAADYVALVFSAMCFLLFISLKTGGRPLPCLAHWQKLVWTKCQARRRLQAGRWFPGPFSIRGLDSQMLLCKRSAPKIDDSDSFLCTTCYKMFSLSSSSQQPLLLVGGDVCLAAALI